VKGAPAAGDIAAVKQVIGRLESDEICVLDKLAAKSQHETEESWRHPRCPGGAQFRTVSSPELRDPAGALTVRQGGHGEVHAAGSSVLCRQKAILLFRPILCNK
jgi:hypothetical protein